MAMRHGKVMNAWTEATAIKYDRLSRFIQNCIVRWWPKTDEVVIVEGTPGSGTCEGHDGSPLIFVKTMINEWISCGKRFRYVACDGGVDEANHCERNAVLLAEKFLDNGWDSLLDEWSRIDDGWSEVVLPKFRHLWEKKHGLLFLDPCGGYPVLKIPKIIADAPDMDILLNIAAHQIGRGMKRNKISALMSKYPDRRWFITTPETKEQWVFIFGTSDRKFDGSELGLHPVDQDIGQDIINRLFANRKYCRLSNKAIARKRAATRANREQIKAKVWKLVQEGYTNKGIAKKLKIHHETVRKDREEMLEWTHG